MEREYVKKKKKSLHNSEVTSGDRNETECLPFYCGRLLVLLFSFIKEKQTNQTSDSLELFKFLES